MGANRITGRVKWFNSKAGYGFITVSEGEFADKDIFVHYSSIKSDASHYKYLTQGEYVDFSLTKPSNEKHEVHAVDVTGVKGGPILCETRRLSAGSARAVPEESNVEVSEEAVEVKRKSKPRAPPSSSSGPAKTKPVSDSDGFTQVKRRSAPRAKKASA